MKENATKGTEGAEGAEGGWRRRPMAFFVFLCGGHFVIRRRGLRYLDQFRRAPENVWGPFGFKREAEEWIEGAMKQN